MKGDYSNEEVNMKQSPQAAGEAEDSYPIQTYTEEEIEGEISFAIVPNKIAVAYHGAE